MEVDECVHHVTNRNFNLTFHRRPTTSVSRTWLAHPLQQGDVLLDLPVYFASSCLRASPSVFSLPGYLIDTPRQDYQAISTRQFVQTPTP